MFFALLLKESILNFSPSTKVGQGLNAGCLLSGKSKEDSVRSATKRSPRSQDGTAITFSDDPKGIRPNRKPCSPPSHLLSASSQPKDFRNETASPRSKESLE